eukprot:TRINITY_DN5729_c0_g1_i1.p1 TRINITY_DN5729_c0_g1~~TRINITY_DN5729_c0_g1_i1.p1  ORF type:complete len:391 (+),score=71.79 TRINITY_DN5729_c0_g1_i1:448-1620(+)
MLKQRQDQDVLPEYIEQLSHIPQDLRELILSIAQRKSIELNIAAFLALQDPLLHSVALSNASIRDVHLGKLAVLKQLTELKLSWCPVTAEGIKSLVDICPQLQSASFRWLSHEGVYTAIPHLVQHCTALRSLTLEPAVIVTALTGEILEQVMQQGTNLTSLHLERCASIPFPALQQLTQLRSLHLLSCAADIYQTAADLTGWNALDTLEVKGLQVGARTDRSLSSVFPKCVRELVLAGTEVPAHTEPLIDYACQLPHLTSLSIAHAKGELALYKMAETMTQLRVLRLRVDARFSDANELDTAFAQLLSKNPLLHTVEFTADTRGANTNTIEQLVLMGERLRSLALYSVSAEQAKMIVEARPNLREFDVIGDGVREVLSAYPKLITRWSTA